MKYKTSTQIILTTLLASAVAGCSGPRIQAPLPELPEMGQPVPIPAAPEREFDFWLGEWDVANHHLRGGKWLASGEARALVQPVVDGKAVLEQWSGIVGGNPLIGMSLRAYDPQLGKWVVYLNWHGGRPGGFSVMHGQRRGDRIELLPPVDDPRERFTFSEAHENGCRWDQAGSSDGESWRTGWVMHFTRRAAPLAVDATNATVHRPPDSAREFAETGKLDFLIGSWSGEGRALGEDGEWRETTASARVSSMIEGFALMQFLDTSGGDKSFLSLGWDRAARGWIAVGLDGATAGLRRMVGSLDGAAVSFAQDEGTTRVRETWSNTERDALHWEREVSRDGGSTWDAVLVLDFVPAIEAD